jgi:hypothetical protein
VQAFRPSTSSHLDLPRVQEYVRNHPEFAEQWVAACVHENIAAQNSGLLGDFKKLFRLVADICTRQVDMEKEIYHLFLTKRTPLIGYVLTCADPLMSFVFKEAHGFVEVLRFVGASPGSNEEQQKPYLATLGLYRGMGAPCNIIAVHEDDGCEHGCAAIDGAVDRALRRARGLEIAPARTEKEKEIDNLSKLAADTRYRMLAQRTEITVRSLQNEFRKDFLKMLVDTVTKKAASEHSEAEKPPIIIGVKVNQRTGKVSKLNETTGEWQEIKPKRSMHAIKKILYKIAKGKDIKMPEAKGPALAPG